jgi:hypothetical protein
MFAELHRLAHLGGNCGGQGAHRIGQRVRDAIVVAGGQEHGHGFTNGPAHAEHTGGQQTVARGGEEHAADGLPGVRAQRERGFAKRVWHGAQRIF